MSRSYKWQPHDGARHALPKSLAEGDAGCTLCSIEVTTKSDEWLEAERYWPTCGACDLAWREEEQILPWPRDGKLLVTKPAQLNKVIAPLTTLSTEPQQADMRHSREGALHGA